MKTNSLTKKYELFCHLIMDEHLFLDPDASYSSICSTINVGQDELESLLFSELGVGGQEMIDRFRIDFPEYLRHKYGEDAFQ